MTASKILDNLVNTGHLLVGQNKPSGPRKRLGPSAPVDGVIISNATRSRRIRTGAKYAKRDSRIAVNMRTGDRYKVTAFDRPAIILPNVRCEKNGRVNERLVCSVEMLETSGEVVRKSR